MKPFRSCSPRPRAILTCNRPLFFLVGPRRSFHSENAHIQPDIVPLRKELKDAAKTKKQQARLNPTTRPPPSQSKWELTVGIEIHAELNTSRKLFSDASASSASNGAAPNSNIALFDLAYPGSQPHFQIATLIPALRAALVLNCDIQRKSSWDRKHYFYQDQPNGYQITQYYEPFARDGHIKLFSHDGIAPEDGESVTVGIKQIQMEQDTAKTIHEPPSSYLLDFNRVSHPLIEIITLPHIHHPSTAAACVRKIQAILKSADACIAGMEIGGLRADVNVSIRRRDVDSGTVERGPNEYYGVTGLGQRTEIKNLSSFKAVEDAIVAERDRQIRVLESGDVVEGETRGWTLGSSETRKLRGKEGEVDYRYMPDPDLGPLIIGKDLVGLLRGTMPTLGDDMLARLTGEEHRMTVKDAKTLMELDDGERLEYYFDVVEKLRNADSDGLLPRDVGRIAGNWVLHELGALFAKAVASWSSDRVPSQKIADILQYLMDGMITTRSAKQVLGKVFRADLRDVDKIVEEENMIIQEISEERYMDVAERLIHENPDMAQKIQKKGQHGKVMWFVGQMLREMGPSANAKRAKEMVFYVLEVPLDVSTKSKGK